MERNASSVPNYPDIFPIERRRIPVLGEIACGTPILTDEQHDSFVMSGTNLDADFCLRAKGDSMIGARIQDGDIVFIKKSDMVANGEIAAVVIEDEATLKRVYYYPEKSKLILTPENPKYEPLVFMGPELDEIHILGKAVAFQSEIK
jgi:repressor LexA